eukprot:11354074-Alexandrium_andersonii.AAC.2
MASESAAAGGFGAKVAGCWPRRNSRGVLPHHAVIAPDLGRGNTEVLLDGLRREPEDGRALQAVAEELAALQLVLRDQALPVDHEVVEVAPCVALRGPPPRLDDGAEHRVLRLVALG